MPLTRLRQYLLKVYFKTFDAEVFDRGAQVAFYFSFSLFPLLFFLVSLFGIVIESSEGLRNELFDYLFKIMPGSAYTLVRRTVDEIVDSSSTGKLTIGLSITLWSASVGIDSLRNALNAIYGLKETRPYWRTKIESLAVTLIFIIIATALLAIIFFGWQLIQTGLHGLGFPVASPIILIGIQWLSIILMMLFACEVIYNLIPNFPSFRWYWITRGSVVAIILWLLLSSGFRLYLEFFNTYNRTYGSLGAVIVLMLWLYLTAIGILIGGVINSVDADASAENNDPPEEPDSEDRLPVQAS